jgi:uncharacterized surface protein with fasciclin (FAS1) repeats
MTKASSRPRFTLGAALLATAFALAPASAMAEPFLVDIAEDVTPQPEGDILSVAAAAGQFQTFLAAVRAAGYEETLRGEGPFTVFAPTDAAFEAMSPAELERLMQPAAHEELLALLSYHVVADGVTSDGVSGQTTREAANGYRLQIDGRNGLRVNDQLVVVPDIEASNGVIQGINSVLAPPVLVAAR